MNIATEEDERNFRENSDMKEIEIKNKRKEDIKNSSSLPGQAEPNRAIEVIEIEKPNVSIIRSEVNFLIYPFFTIDNKKTSIKEIEFESTVERGGQKVTIFWGVYPNVKFGTPRQFDKKVFDAIQEIIETLPKPLQNPIPIGSLYSLCKRIGINPNEGKNYMYIRESLLRLRSITIVSRGTFYDKGRKMWIEDTFGLYDRIVWVGEELPDGTIADTNYIYLGSKYLENINNSYVRPIDYDFYKKLNSPIAKRLYEILGVKFYAIFQSSNFIPHIRYLYDTLCNLIPVTRFSSLSRIRQQFALAISELTEGKFLEKCLIQKEGKNIYFTFFPGPRAKEEFSWPTSNPRIINLPLHKRDYQRKILVKTLSRRSLTNPPDSQFQIPSCF